MRVDRSWGQTPSRPLNAVSPTVGRIRTAARQPPCELPTPLQPLVTRLTPMSNAPATSTEVPSAYPPPADFAANANATGELYAEGRERPAGVLGRPGQPAELADPVQRGARLVAGTVREVVRGRQAQRRLQLCGPSCRGGQRRPGRDPLGGGTGRPRSCPCPRHHLRPAQGRGQQGRQCAGRARPDRRRPCRHLHADGARGDRGDAGLRPPGRHARCRLRGLLGQCAQGPRRGRRGQARHHHRRPVPARQGGLAQGRG